MKERVNFLKNFILDLIFPNFCLNCKKEGEWICQDCKSEVKFWNDFLCPYCQKKNCQCHENFLVKKVYIGCSYDENRLIKSALQVFKYKYAQNLANDLVEIFSKNFENLDFDLIIPIPLHESRYKQRGYNQAELLARCLAQKLNLPCRIDLIKRKKKTKQQAKLKKDFRFENVKDAFVAVKRNDIVGKNFLVVDDVLTTGATMNSCAKTLFDSKAKNVCAWVIAKG